MSGADDVVDVMRSLADVSEAFIEIAATLRSIPGAPSVGHQCSMRRETRVGEDHFILGRGHGFRVEWHAEAQFPNGRALTFVEEVSWHESEWTVEGSVKVSDGDWEESLVELPIRPAVDPEDVVVQLVGQARLLLDSRERAIRRFAEV